MRLSRSLDLFPIVLPLLACIGGLGSTARAQAPSLDPPKPYPDATLAPAASVPPNPYLSLLPSDADPDWGYWRARLHREGRRRAAAKAGHGPYALQVEEAEPASVRGLNDAPGRAELIAGFGTAPGAHRAADVRGRLSPPPPRALISDEEDAGPSGDDGSIPLAFPTGLQTGERVRIRATIGDGPHGSLGGGTGDYDVYYVPNVQGGQVLTIDIDTPPDADPRLDAKVAVYDSSGAMLETNDDGAPDSPDSFLTFPVEAPGPYFVIVRGINSSWPSDPFDSSSGPKAGSEGAYTITLGLDADDVDFFGIDLQPGDVLGFTVDDQARRIALHGPDGAELMGSGLDASALLPAASPLPGGGNAAGAYVVHTGGRHTVSASSGDGPYTLALRIFRPPSDSSGAVQTLFLDFDGARIDAHALFFGNPDARLSPLAAFLGHVGLDPTPGGADERAVVDQILRVVRENLEDDVLGAGPNPRFRIRILNSLDHPDPFGAPHVSRVIVGGTREEAGRNTVGIAESVDVGNFATEETALVLLDLLTTPGHENSLHPLIDAGAPAVDVLAAAVGSIVAHEAGHLFANFHTGRPGAPANLMDGRPHLPSFLGVGPDGRFGTDDDIDVDFGPAPFNDDEGFTGTQDTRAGIAFGLFGPQTPVYVDAQAPSPFRPLLSSFPNPFRDRATVELRLPRPEAVRVEVFDLLGRRVRVLFAGTSAFDGTHRLLLEARDLPDGPYLIRATSASFRHVLPILLAR